MVSTPADAGIDFPGKEPQEHVRFYFRQHWIRMVGPFVRAFLWTLLLFFTSATRFVGYPLDDETRRFILVPLTFFFVFFQMQLVRRWYEYFLHIVIVTDLKVHSMKRKFLLMELERSVDIPTIRDVRREQRGPIQLMFGYGTLLLDTAQGELKIHFVPKISKLQDALVVQREEKRPGNGNGQNAPQTPSQAPAPDQQQMLQDVKAAVETLKPYAEGQ
jgi:hypothetical protein